MRQFNNLRYSKQIPGLQFGPLRTRCQFLPIGRSALRLPRFRAVVVISRCSRMFPQRFCGFAKSDSIEYTALATGDRPCFGLEEANKNIATTFCREWADQTADGTSSSFAGQWSSAPSLRPRLPICSICSVARIEASPN